MRYPQMTREATAVFKRCNDLIMQTIYPQNEPQPYQPTPVMQPNFEFCSTSARIDMREVDTSQEETDTQSGVSLAESPIEDGSQYPKVRSCIKGETHPNWVHRLCRLTQPELVNESRKYYGFTTHVQPNRKKEEDSFERFYQRQRDQRYYRYETPEEVTRAQNEYRPLPKYYTRWPLLFQMSLIDGTKVKVIYDPHLRESSTSPAMECHTGSFMEPTPYKDHVTRFYAIAYRPSSPYRCTTFAQVKLQAKEERDAWSWTPSRSMRQTL